MKKYKSTNSLEWGKVEAVSEKIFFTEDDKLIWVESSSEKSINFGESIDESIIVPFKSIIVN